MLELFLGKQQPGALTVYNLSRGAGRMDELVLNSSNMKACIHLLGPFIDQY